MLYLVTAKLEGSKHSNEELKKLLLADPTATFLLGRDSEYHFQTSRSREELSESLGKMIMEHFPGEQFSLSVTLVTVMVQN